MTSNIQIILFDFGKVLGSETNVLALDPEIAERTGLSKEKLLEIFLEHWNVMKVGQENLDDYHGAIARKSLNSITVDELRKLHREKIWKNSEVFDLVNELKNKEFRVMILSNESKQGMQDKVEKFNLNDVFEKIYVSADVGSAKPDRKIFEYVISDLKIDSNTILFIDDWDKNIATAGEVGMQAIQFIDVNQLSSDLLTLTSEH